MTDGKKGQKEEAVSLPVAHPVVFYDGVCNLCQASVRFIIRRDPKILFRFASLQSPWGERILKTSGIDEPLTSIVLWEAGRVYTHSEAVWRIARRLKAPWRWFRILRWIPAPLRDRIYIEVARRRYRWFGKQEACWVPNPALRARFLQP